MNDLALNLSRHRQGCLDWRSENSGSYGLLRCWRDSEEYGCVHDMQKHFQYSEPVQI